MLALRTFGPGSSSSPWPTPAARDGQGKPSRDRQGKGVPRLASLETAAGSLWPTASAGDAENATGYARGNPSLIGAMFPTPAARDAKGRDRPERQGGQGLESALVEPGPATGKARADRWDTPMARDAGTPGTRDRKDGRAPAGLERQVLYPTPTATAYGTNAGGQKPGPARPSIERLLLEQHSSATAGELYSTPTASSGGEAKSMAYGKPGWNSAPTLADQIGTSSKLALNPAWVEHLMGFPPGWTDQPAILRYRRADS